MCGAFEASQGVMISQRAGSQAVQRANRLIFANIALQNPLLAQLRLAGLRLASRIPGVVDRMVRREALLDQAVNTVG